MTTLERRRWGGLALITGSALLFAWATVLVKWLTREGVAPVVVAYGRFLLGFLLMSVLLAARRQSPRPRDWVGVVGRAVANTFAVLLFYTAIRWTTLTKANLLNMTYPLFVAVLGPLVLREPSGGRRYAGVVAGFVGIWMVLNPRWGEVNRGDLYGLLCGLVSAGAILFLRRARRRDDANVIVWTVMLTGTVLLSPWSGGIADLNVRQLGLWLFAAAAGIVGQLLITTGYRYVSAVDGSVASSARVVFAAAFGVMLFAEPLSLNLVFGGILVLGALFWISRTPVTPKLR